VALVCITAPASVIGGAAGVCPGQPAFLVAGSGAARRTTAASRRWTGRNRAYRWSSRIAQRELTAAITDLEVAERLHSSVCADREDGLLRRHLPPVSPMSPPRFGRACEIVPRHWDDSIFALRERPMPIAQDPMTRVSDSRHSLPRSPVRAGSVHCLALSTADQTRSVCNGRHRAGRAAVGSGRAGFRAGGDQIGPTGRHSEIRRLRHCRRRSSVAGAALEDVAISTFLHVPSRVCSTISGRRARGKFIFEGSNAAVHRPAGKFSFVEAQLGPDRFPRQCSGCRLGLARSSLLAVCTMRAPQPMVAVLAAPLAAVVRGRAFDGYGISLHEEAVACGAVQRCSSGRCWPRRDRIAGNRPRHATRAVASPFTESFRSARHALRGRWGASRELATARGAQH